MNFVFLHKKYDDSHLHNMNRPQKIEKKLFIIVLHVGNKIITHHPQFSGITSHPGVGQSFKNGYGGADATHPIPSFFFISNLYSFMFNYFFKILFSTDPLKIGCYWNFFLPFWRHSDVTWKLLVLILVDMNRGDQELYIGTKCSI